MNAPGWYPDPQDPSRNLYWDGRQWHRNGAPPTAAQAVTPPQKPKRRILLWVAVLLAGLWLISQCTSTDRENTSSSTTSSSVAASPTSETPDAWKYIPGNGTHQMGGAGGKNWGTWVSDGTTGVTPGGTCRWSIVSVAPDRGGEILDEGEAPAGQPVTVAINPDGKVDGMDGTIGEDDHRIVFMTNNCGAWTPEN